MFGTVFDRTTSLLSKRFVLGLVMPVLAFFAGVGALVATQCGWDVTLSWWAKLGGSRQALLATAFVAALVFAATLLGTQLIPLTRVLEGYWGRLGGPGAELGDRLQRKRRGDLEEAESDPADLRLYQEFPDNGDLQPTRLGNILKAAESYPGDEERWALDAVFWWSRLYLVLPDVARQAVDDARSTMDQMVVMTWLTAAFGLVAIGFGLAGLVVLVWLPCAIGALILSRACYLATASAAIAFGEQVRSCFDLYRHQLLTGLGWNMPPRWQDERDLWQALQQQLYRRGADKPELLARPRDRRYRERPRVHG